MTIFAGQLRKSGIFGITFMVLITITGCNSSGTDGGQNTQDLSAPTNLSSQAISSNRIDLSWEDNASDEDGYKIERSVGGGSFSEIASIQADTESYSDTGLTPSMTYSYRIKAYRGTESSTYSEVAEAETAVASTAPAAPSVLAATADGSNRISITWQDNSDNEEK